jgi:hypothetical protein
MFLYEDDIGGDPGDGMDVGDTPGVLSYISGRCDDEEGTSPDGPDRN